MNVYFSKADISADPNDHITNIEFRGMLKGKVFGKLDSVLPFVTAFVNIALCEQHQFPMTDAYTKACKV